MENTRVPKALDREIGAVIPLGIAYIAAYLRQNGVAVAMLDADAEGLGAVEVGQRMAVIAPDLVGITTMTPTVHDDLALAAIAKSQGARVVMGGPQVNAMPMETMAHGQVDFAILGEGEVPMLQLVRVLEGQGELSAVAGLVYRTPEGEVVANPAYILPDLDLLPFPARDLLPSDRYHSIISKGRLSSLCVGRGCPYQCGFCFKQPSDRKVRYRRAEHVLNEVEEAVNRFAIQEFNLVTDTLTIKADFISDFCEGLLQRKINISWIAPTRVDHVTLEMLKLMKKAGCRSLRFGIESGSPRILKQMNKKIDHQQALLAFQWAREIGLESFAYLIIGYLEETEETFRETLEFVRRLQPDLVMYNIATPLPGTPLFQQAVAANLIAPDYWQKFVLGETRERVPYLCPHTDGWIAKAYRDFYFSPGFLWKRLLQFHPRDLGASLRAVRGLFNLGRGL